MSAPKLTWPAQDAERGSVQQRRYISFRRFGHSTAEAAAAAPMPIEIARLTDKDFNL